MTLPLFSLYFLFYILYFSFACSTNNIYVYKCMYIYTLCMYLYIQNAQLDFGSKNS